MKLSMVFPNRDERILLESWPNGKRILIITGKINSGKSSKLEKIIRQLNSAGKNIKGFITKGIFTDSCKIGYNLIDISTGAEYHLASISSKNNFILKQGRFYFNEAVFEEVNNKLIENFNGDVIVFDEIGHLELNKKGFYRSLNVCMKNFKGKLIIVVRGSLLENILSAFQIHNDDFILTV